MTIQGLISTSLRPVSWVLTRHSSTAGVEKDSLEIEAKENTIRVSGRKTIKYGEVASMHRRERVSGAFDRTLSVPIQIDPDAVTA